MTSQATAHRIVQDGYIRLWKALDPQVRAEVEAEYSERLASASVWRRVTLQRQMRREIERRIRQRAPADGLY